LGTQLGRMGHDVRFVTPDGFRTVPMPTYAEIRLALFARRAIDRIIEEFKPEAIHIATGGPLGLATRARARVLSMCLSGGPACTKSNPLAALPSS